MMSSKTDIEMKWLHAVIMSEVLKSGRFIENYTPDKAYTFKIIDIQIHFIGVEESFMLTSCYRATIVFEYLNKRDTRTFVVKKTPEVPQEIYDSINFRALFTNEIQAYTKIMPTLEHFTHTKFTIPKFVYANMKPYSATIMLEDFKVSGWRLSDDKVNLSLDHVITAVKFLGNFHGCGFALRHCNRLEFEKISDLLLESRYATQTLHPEWDLTARQCVKRLVKAVHDHQSGVSEEFLRQFEKLIADVFSYGKQRVQPVEPMITLCHGDFLRNNVAYRYGKGEDGEEKPLDILLFDLQTMRSSSPMVDLSIFLSLSTFAGVRYTNFKQIFEAYTSALAAAFKDHTMQELPEYLSSESLLKEYVRFLPYAISTAAYFLMTLVEAADMSSEELLCQNRTTEEIIRYAMETGGETVNIELAHQVREMYDLSVQLDVDICDGFDYAIENSAKGEEVHATALQIK